jgi:NAD-dependent dihydropyrimidine dehydrogenase PreA subunit
MSTDSLDEDKNMTYVIAAPCIDHMDRACVEACPFDAISNEHGIDRKMFIDPDACQDCGSCEVACPNQAIYPSDELPGPWADFAWTDMAWYRDRNAARAVVHELVPQVPAR